MEFVELTFEWNEEKRASNLAKHGLDFADAYRIFEIPMYVVIDSREDYGESRYQGIGLLIQNYVVIVFSEPDEDTIRLISLRRATKLERKIYDSETYF